MNQIHCTVWAWFQLLGSRYFLRHVNNARRSLFTACQSWGHAHGTPLLKHAHARTLSMPEMQEPSRAYVPISVPSEWFHPTFDNFWSRFDFVSFCTFEPTTVAQPVLYQGPKRASNASMKWNDCRSIDVLAIWCFAHSFQHVSGRFCKYCRDLSSSIFGDAQWHCLIAILFVANGSCSAENTWKPHLNEPRWVEHRTSMSLDESTPGAQRGMT